MISAIVLKIAARCNLNCSYCYVYNHQDRSYLERPKLISDSTYEATLARIREYCERRGSAMAINFHGGEPTLIGVERFERLATRAREVLGEHLSLLALQTNGLLLDDRWVTAFLRHGVHVGVSLDGPPEINDAARVDHQGRGSHARTLAGIEVLRRGGIQPRILSVVSPGRDGAAAYRYLRSLDVVSMDFLLPDVSHDSKETFYPGLGPTPVADFLIPAFDAWFDEQDPEVDVRLFSDVLRVLLGGEGACDALGNPLMGYLIVETDGAIEALDALRVCAEGIGKSGLDVHRHGFDDLGLGLPLVHRAVHEGFPLPVACRACAEREICAGGYLPHRYSRARGFDNRSVWCADILALLAHVRRRAGAFAELRPAC